MIAIITPSIAYLIDFVTFAAWSAVYMIRFILPPENAERPSLQECLKYAFSGRTAGRYFIDMAAMFFAFPQALYPAAAVYGSNTRVFPAAIAIGALIGANRVDWQDPSSRNICYGRCGYGSRNCILRNGYWQHRPRVSLSRRCGFFDMIWEFSRQYGIRRYQTIFADVWHIEMITI